MVSRSPRMGVHKSPGWHLNSPKSVCMYVHIHALYMSVFLLVYISVHIHFHTFVSTCLGTYVCVPVAVFPQAPLWKSACMCDWLFLLHPCLWRSESRSMSLWPCLAVKVWVTVCVHVTLLRPCLSVKIWVTMSMLLSLLHPVSEGLSHCLCQCGSVLHQCLWRFEALSVSVWLTSTSVSVVFWVTVYVRAAVFSASVSVKVWVTNYVSSMSLLHSCLAVKFWVTVGEYMLATFYVHKLCLCLCMSPSL